VLVVDSAAGVGLFVVVDGGGGTVLLVVAGGDGLAGVGGVGLVGVALVVASVVVVVLVADVGFRFTGATTILLVTGLEALILTTLVASLATLFALMVLVTATGFLSRVGSLVGRWTGRSRGLGLALALLLLGRGRVVDVVVGDGAGVHGCDRGGRPGGAFPVLFGIAILGVAILLNIAICGV
jgi:hypothetical protein